MFEEKGFNVSQYWDEGFEKANMSQKLEVMLKRQALDLAAVFFQKMFADAFQIVKPIITQEVKDNIQNGY